MAMVSLDSAHLMNSQAASFFFEPAGMPGPWLLEPGKLPAGPAGIRPYRTVFCTVLSGCLASGTIQRTALGRVVARPDICERIDWSSEKDRMPSGPYLFSRLAYPSPDAAACSVSRVGVRLSGGALNT